MEYYLFTDRQLGPFTLDQLRTLPELTAEVNVWKDGMADWAPASTVPELQQILAERNTPAGINEENFDDPDVVVVQAPDEPPTNIMDEPNYGPQVVAPQYQPEPQQPSYAPQQQIPEQNYAQPQYENTASPKKSHKGLWTLLIILGVVIAAAVAAFFTNPKREAHTGVIEDAITAYAENCDALADCDDKTRKAVVKQVAKKVQYNDYFVFSTTAMGKTTTSWGLFGNVIDRTGDLDDKDIDKAIEKALKKGVKKK